MQWKQDVFTTSADAEYLLFEGIRGGVLKENVDGYMAIDDLSIVTYCEDGGENRTMK